MEIDYNKLSRDYRINPIKQKETLIYEDVYYLYWELNLTKKQVSKIIGCSDKRIYNFIKEHKLIKSQEMITASQKQLMFERYGVDNYMKTKQGIEKCTKAIRKVFKEQKEIIVKKREETCLKNSGYRNPSQNPTIKRKKEKTCLKNYGTRNPQQNETIKQQTQKTFIEKYNGNPLSSKSTIYNDRVIKGIENKYGCKNVMQNEEIAQKTAKTLKENQKIYKQQNLEKYGYEYPAQVPSIRKKNSEGVIKALSKMCETREKNGTWVQSKDEKFIALLLEEKFNTVRHPYYDEKRYPFKCDFYITELDLFIEYQGFEGHGGHPFDINNELDIKKVFLWKQKADEINFKGNKKEKYLNYIETWTIRDVKKRQTAKNNNLNWIEFFNMDEFMEWYNKL